MSVIWQSVTNTHEMGSVVVDSKIGDRVSGVCIWIVGQIKPLVLVVPTSSIIIKHKTESFPLNKLEKVLYRGKGLLNILQWEVLKRPLT